MLYLSINIHLLRQQTLDNSLRKITVCWAHLLSLLHELVQNTETPASSASNSRSSKNYFIKVEIKISNVQQIHIWRPLDRWKKKMVTVNKYVLMTEIHNTDTDFWNYIHHNNCKTLSWKVKLIKDNWVCFCSVD